MRIGIIGAGRIAQSLGRLLHEHGATIVGVASRTSRSAEAAASFIDSSVRPLSVAQLAHQTDHVLLAVSDHALPSVIQQLANAGFGNGVVLHTCGGAGLAPFAPIAAGGASTGILHPLQTVPTPEQGVRSLPGSYFAIGGDAAAVAWAADITKQMNGHAVQIAPHAWPLYHAAAVMASNYQCALIDSALELLVHSGLDRESALSAIAPIVSAATQNILSSGPRNALTGPIQRGDAITVQSHLDALTRASAETRQLYIAAGLRALPIARERGLAESAAATIKSALTAAHS